MIYDLGLGIWDLEFETWDLDGLIDPTSEITHPTSILLFIFYPKAHSSYQFIPPVA
jgi:hypothetical protein